MRLCLIMLAACASAASADSTGTPADTDAEFASSTLYECRAVGLLAGTAFAAEDPAYAKAMADQALELKYKALRQEVSSGAPPLVAGRLAKEQVEANQATFRNHPELVGGFQALCQHRHLLPAGKLLTAEQVKAVPGAAP